MPPKSPSPSLGRLYSVLEGRRKAKRITRSNVQEADFELDRYRAKI